MTQGGNYEEVVRIVWDVQQAERAIDGLVSKIDRLSSQTESAGLRAGERFSSGFSAGMAGAMATADQLLAKLEAIQRLQAGVNVNVPPGPTYTAPSPTASFVNEYGEAVSSKPRVRYNAADVSYQLGRRDYLGQAYDEYGQPRFPNPIQGGSGIFEQGVGGGAGRYRNELGQFFRPDPFRGITPYAAPGMGLFGTGSPPPPIFPGPIPQGGNVLGGFLGPGPLQGQVFGQGRSTFWGPAGPPNWPGGMPNWGAGGGAGVFPGQWAGGAGGGGGFVPPPNFMPGGIFGGGGAGVQVQGLGGGGVPGPGGSQLLRHATWMAQTVAIGAAFAAAAVTAKQFGDELVRLDTVFQRLNFINGTTQTQTVNAFMQAAQAGIAPAQAQGGLIAAAQYDLTASQNRDAQQLAAVFGAEQYANIVAEYYQTQQRANAVGVEQVNIMDFIATAYKTGQGTLEEYFDSLQMGIELTNVLGLESEQAGLAILKMSQGLEGTPADAAALIQAVRRRLTGPGSAKTREALAEEGITGPSLPEYMQQISQMAAMGDPQQFERVLQLIAGAGMNVTTRLANMRTGFVELYEVMGNPPEMEGWDAFWSQFSDTTQFKINQVKASWAGMLLAFGDTGAVTKSLGFVEKVLQNWSGIFQDLPTVLGAVGHMPSRSEQAQYEAAAFQQAKTLTPGDLLNAAFWINVIATGIRATGIQGRQPSAQRGVLGASGVDTAPPGSISGERAGPSKFGPIGGFAELPQGADFGRFLELLSAATARLAAIPGYEPELQTTAILDQGKRTGREDDRYRVLQLDDRALIMALEDLADEIDDDKKQRRVRQTKNDPMDDFGGFDTFPKGLDWDAFVSGVRAMEAKLVSQVPGYELDQKSIAFYDETTGFYRMLTADQEAIRRELAEQTKLMNQQITGVFNVPSGGEALVAFFALQQGLVQAGTTDGTSGGSVRPSSDIKGLDKAANDFNNSSGMFSGATTKFDFSIGKFATAVDKLLDMRWTGDADKAGDKGKPGVPKIDNQGGKAGIPKNYLDDEDDKMRVITPARQADKGMAGAPKPVGQQSTIINTTINLRNQVVLNGRIIVDQLLREFQRQLRGNARVSGTGGRTNLGV